jgi:branched-chain amino acid transport system substrate-binding protein
MAKIKKINYLVALNGLILSLLLSACGSAASTTETVSVRVEAGADSSSQASVPSANQAGGTIRIYSSLPLTGSSRDQSQTLVNAMQMALEDIGGAEKTVAGFKIEYVSLDDATANDPDAMVYLGTFNSGAAKIAIPILNQANMAMISPANTLPGLTTAVPGLTAQGEPNIYYPTQTRNYFRVVARDDLQGPAAAKFAVNKLGAKRIFLVDDSEAYGKGLADAFESAVKSRGSAVAVVGRVSITGKESNYRDLARQIKSANPDFIFFGGIAQKQPGKLLIDIRAGGVSAAFMGGDGINNPAFVKEAAVAGEGAYSSISGTPVEKLPAKGQDFLKRYQERFGAPTAYTIYGYEAMAVALNAIKVAGKKDRQAILQAVAATKDFDGVLGKWSFDANGDTTLTDFAVYKIQAKRLVYLEQTQPR